MAKKTSKPSSEDSKKGSLPSGFSTAKTHEVDDVTKSLTAIYGKQPGAAQEELSRFDKGQKHVWMFMGIGTVIFVTILTAAAWLGFYWWSGRAQGVGLQVAIEGPSNVALGQENTFFINWFNRSNDPLANTELRVTFPSDFSVESVDPQPSEGADKATSFTVQLGAEPPQAHGTVKVVGTFTGNLGTKSAVQVLGTYRPATFNSDFEIVASKDLAYTDSVLDGALTLPPKVLPGDDVAIVYNVTNKGDASQDNLEARLTLPDGFVRDASSTGDALDGQVVRIPIGSIAAGASSTVRVTGVFALGVHGDVNIHVEVGHPTVSDGSFAATQRTDGTLSVLSGDLSVKVVLNGSDGDRSAALGERQHLAISYENTSGEELRDIVLRLHFGSDPALPHVTIKPAKGKTAAIMATDTIDLVDWSQLDDATHGQRDDDVLTYGADQIGQLERLPADGNGLIELAVPLIGHATSGRDMPIVVAVEATIGSVGGVTVNRTVATQPIALHLRTDAALNAVARYSSEEGAPLGSGPLPPVAGTSTTYRVEWDVAKSFHALGHVAVSASLPQGVNFVASKQVDTGVITYDPDKRLVTWTADAIPENASDTLASFDVVLTPSEADVGRFADLVGESRFEFTDAKLNESLLRTSPALDTDLPNDDLAKGKGVVKKP